MSNYIIHNGELYHYGVKGMKWGVRRSTEVRSVNKQYKKELRSLKRQRNKDNFKNNLKAEVARTFLGEAYGGYKRISGRKEINSKYKTQKEELQKKYESQFVDAKGKAEKRIAEESVKKLSESNKTKRGAAIAAGVLVGIGAAGTAAMTVYANKIMKSTGLSAKEWVQMAASVGSYKSF